MMKNKRRFIDNNQGYSLVEMIIVIAIIVVMTGAATITVVVMRSAKSKEAATNFESEVAELATKSRGQICVVEDPASGDEVQKPEYRHCIRLYVSGDKLYIQKGFYKGSNYPLNSAASYDFPTSLNVGNGKGISLSADIRINYTDTDGNVIQLGGTSTQVAYIVYDKSGTCISGAGVYDFCKKDGSGVSSVRINKNGSHQSY